MSDKTVLWWLAAVIPLFLVYRLPYFLMSKYELLRIAGDSSWWWIIQRWFDREGQGFNTFFLENRVNFRLPTDIFWQENIVALSNRLNIDLMDLNLVITSLFLIACSSFIFLIGQQILKHPIWSFLFTISFMMAAYVGFLRYPVFVPKLIGFTLFPLIMIYSLDMVENNRGYLRNFLLYLLLMCTYFVSFSYTAPAICASTVLTGLFLKYKKSEFMPYLKQQTAFWLAIVATGIIVMFVIKGDGGVLHPPPLEVTELVYSNHQFSVDKLMYYLKTHRASLMAVFVGAFLILKYGDYDARFRFSFSAITFFVLFSGGIISHALASYIDFFRSTWYWRTTYYSYLPATLCLFIGLRSIPKSLFEKKYKVHILIFCTILLFTLSFLSAQTKYFNKSRQYWRGISFQPVYLGGAPDNLDDELHALVSFAQGLPYDSLILMPPINKQNFDTDIFEAESGVPVTLSQNDRMHLIYESPLTYSYAEDVRRYYNIIALPNGPDRTKAFVEFAVEKNISHILIRNRKGQEVSSPVLTEVFKNPSWIVYSLKNS